MGRESRVKGPECRLVHPDSGLIKKEGRFKGPEGRITHLEGKCMAQVMGYYGLTGGT